MQDEALSQLFQPEPYTMVARARLEYSFPRACSTDMFQGGLSMICIILRNIDAEANDYDLLLYCYLKV